MAKDVVIPIVFPDYLIAVKIPEVKVEAPDYLPWFDILPESVAIPKTKNKKQKTKNKKQKTKNKVPDLGIAKQESQSCAS